jgi:hypothetical protein
MKSFRHVGFSATQGWTLPFLSTPDLRFSCLSIKRLIAMIYTFNNGRTNLLCTKLTSTTLGSKLDRGNLLWVGTDVRTPGPKIGSWTTHAVRGCGRQVVEAVDKYENLIFEMFLISGQNPNFSRSLYLQF